jgi:hypothetical protein
MALSRPARDQRDRLRSEPGHCALAHSTTAPSGFAGWGRRGFDRREATASQTTARAPPQTKHPSQGVCFTPKSVFVKRNSTENRDELLLCTKHAFVPIRPRVGGSPSVVHRKSQSRMPEGILRMYIGSDDGDAVWTNRTRLTPRGTSNQKIRSMIRRSKSAKLPRDSHESPREMMWESGRAQPNMRTHRVRVRAEADRAEVGVSAGRCCAWARAATTAAASSC